MSLSELLRSTLCKKFPRGTDDSPLKMKMMGSAYDYYSLSKIDKDPDDLFEKTHGFFEEVLEMMESENLSQARKAAYEEHSIDTMGAMIFGSNMIEKAGSSENITQKLCKDIFAGVPVASEIPLTHPDCLAMLTHILRQNRPATHKSINHSRIEVTQHATAWTYLLSSLLSGPLTESHLRTAHLILCADLPLNDHTPYAGLYRLISVHAGLNSFPPYTSVPALMRTLVYDYNAAIDLAKTVGFLDPFALAAEFGHRFVNIHPFVDGNGRVCRMLMNAILFCYAGVVVPLGETEEGRDAYLGVVVRASEGEGVREEGGKKAWAELSSLLVLEACGRFEKLRDKLRAVD
jgi:fido (protein-threonine AMPylation protein)